MLRIRLSRVGKRKQPSYRIVVTDGRNPRAGSHIEIIGHYNPLANPAALTVKEDRVVYWLQNGAQPSDTTAKILSRAGLMEQAGRAPVTWGGKVVAPGKKKQKALAATAAAAPAAAAPAPPAAAPTAPAAAAPAAPTTEEPAPEPPVEEATAATEDAAEPAAE